MKTKLTQSIPLLFALLVIGFTHFSQWCTNEGQICFRTVIDRIFPYVITPLYLFSLYLIPLTLILIFVSRAAFSSWLRLAAWALPLALLFVASQPVVAGLFSTDRDDAARLAALVFSLVSLLWVAYRAYVTRRAVTRA
jgi:hypothetical protein